MAPRPATPADELAMTEFGFRFASGTGNEYSHFRGTRFVDIQHVCVLTRSGWVWSPDNKNESEPFDDPITCYIAAELAGWKL